MRDILVTLIVFGSLPFIARRPVNGVFMWVWVSVMQPHMLAWGFATTFPFALVVALCTTTSMLFSRVPRTLRLPAPTVALLAFGAWTCLAASLSGAPRPAPMPWPAFLETTIMTLVCTMLTKTRRDIERLVMVLAASLAFYGVVGGICAMRSVFSERAAGPPGSFIVDSNAIALALLMTLPLLFQIRAGLAARWLRRLLAAVMLLCAIAAVGSSSRGAILAIGAMAGFFWRRRDKGNRLGAALLCTLPLLVLLLPGQEVDAAAHERLRAWGEAIGQAQAHLFGDAARPAAHSIYFQVLGELGFPGLALYLLLGVLTWRSASWTARAAAGRPDLAWAAALATMVQASLVAFAVGGAFVGLAYFDVPYYLMAAVVATRVLVENDLAQVRGIPCKSLYPS
jgi:putative inorganic carbon (HCO3(-)) transporter